MASLVAARDELDDTVFSMNIIELEHSKFVKHDTVQTEKECTIHYWIYNYKLGCSKLVFIQGLGTSHYGFTQQIEYLCKLKNSNGTPLFTIVAIDNRGIGQSTVTHSSCYPIQLMARDARAVLRKIGWWHNEKLHLLGMSMGGMIAQELYILNPKKFISLALICTTSGGNFFTNIPPFGGLWGVVKQTTATSQESLREAIAKTVFSPEFYETHRTKILRCLQEINERDGHFASTTAVIAQTRGLMKHDCLDRLVAAIGMAHSTRVFAMAGTGDVLIDYHCSQKIAEALHAKNYQCELVLVPNVGHCVTDEAADEFNASILHHIAEAEKQAN